MTTSADITIGIDSLPFPACIISRNLMLLGANGKFCDIAGMEPGSIAGNDSSLSDCPNLDITPDTAGQLTDAIDATSAIEITGIGGRTAQGNAFSER